MTVKPVHTPMVDLPAQGMSKENQQTAPVAPTLTLAGTQAAADNPLEAALRQATREEAKLPDPSLVIEPVCTGPDATMNPVKSDIPTANAPVRTDAGNGKLIVVAGDKVLLPVTGMTQVVPMTRLSLHLALQVAEGAWGNTTSGGLSLKQKLYPLARKGSMAEIAKARLLGGRDRHPHLHNPRRYRPRHIIP